MHEDEISIVRLCHYRRFIRQESITNICVAVAVEMDDSNDAMNVIGIPMIIKSSAAIVTTSNRNELEDARKCARQLVEEVGYTGRDDILALCSKFSNEPQILSVAQYHESLQLKIHQQPDRAK